MAKLIESSDYPLINIKLKIGDYEDKHKVYVDTGAYPYHLYFPRKIFEKMKIKPAQFKTPVITTKTRELSETYPGIITIGNKEWKKSTIVVLDDTTFPHILLGRGILDDLVATFNGPTKKLIIND